MNYRGFVKVKDVPSLSQVRGVIDLLVLTDAVNGGLDEVNILTKEKERITKIVYICSEDKASSALKIFARGSGGNYIDDEYALSSSNELNEAIGSIDKITEISELGGVPVLKDFTTQLKKGGELKLTRSYLNIVDSAVNDVVAKYKEKQLELIKMSEEATEIFTEASEIVQEIRNSRNTLESELNALEEKIKDMENIPSQSGLAQAGVVFFPRVTYQKNKEIIRIKDTGGCKYINTFTVAFRNYIENVKHRRPKVIFIFPVGSLYEKMYSGSTWVTNRNTTVAKNYYEDIIFTNFPSTDTLTRMLEDDNKDIFIVVDKTVNDKEHILNCKGKKTRYAVSGSRAIEQLGLNRGSCITSVMKLEGSMFAIPMFEIPAIGGEGLRRTKILQSYLTNCIDEFETMLNDR